MGVGVNAAPRSLYPWERPGTHRKGSWMSSRTFLDGAENLAPTEIQSPNRPARSLVTINTTLFRPTF